MALTGEGDYMATATTTRSKMNLHNFALPKLKWGSQRHLMCMKTESDGVVGEQRLRRRSSPSRRNHNPEVGIGEFREQIMSDIRTMTESIFRKQGFVDGDEAEEEEKERSEREVSPPEAPGSTAAEVRPWNLRKRRAACKAPVVPESEIVVEEKRERCREKKEDRLNNKFVSSLSKKEIEDDFMVLMGHKPPRRPKKRPRTVQKVVNVLYPAYYLPEVVTEDMYNIDTSETRKR